MPVALLLLALVPTAPLGEHATLLGNLREGELTAWEVRVEARRDDGSSDTYRLVEVMDATTGEKLATFRASWIGRRAANGQPLAVPESTLLRLNPRYAVALPAVEWTRLLARERLTAPDDGTLRLAQRDLP